MKSTLNSSGSSKRFSALIGLLFVVAIIGGCQSDMEIGGVPPNGYTINLRWNRAYSDETQEKVETGLLWSLSFLGAELPSGSFDRATEWKGNILQVDLSTVGFTSSALSAVEKLLRYCKQGDEYQMTGGIDIGRFIMLTLNSSNHYYAITGASTALADFTMNRKFDPKFAAIIESSISFNNRLIQLPDSSLQSLLNTAFVAHECDGNVTDGTHSVNEYETTELMTNGQFRFAIYDVQGKRVAAANSEKTLAGKPAKCLWCHESHIQLSFAAKTVVNGFYDPDMFKQIVSTNMSFVDNYRKTLNSDLDFDKTQDHTYAELLYISFMEPSAERLSLEWNMTVEQVSERLKNLPTHRHPEFKYLGILYDRKDVDAVSPYPVIEVPQSARDESLYEPDLLR